MPGSRKRELRRERGEFVSQILVAAIVEQNQPARMRSELHVAGSNPAGTAKWRVS